MWRRRKAAGFRPSERAPGHWHGVGAFDLDAVSRRKAVRVIRGCSARRSPRWLTAIRRSSRSRRPCAAGPGSTPSPNGIRTDFFDVGICEGHAVVFAAGLAASGYRPFFAVYSTFLQRAVDCVMHDVCLSKLPVVFCVDRAGVVGSDGPTHHGIYDIPMLRCLPNLTIMQPKDAAELVAMLKAALVQGTPTVIRYPRDPGPAVAFSIEEAAPLPLGKAEVVLAPPSAETRGAVWLWALGDMGAAGVCDGRTSRRRRRAGRRCERPVLSNRSMRRCWRNRSLRAHHTS
jgi:1-deoxy-D-xylulose-5-phosphate synthase